MIDAVIDFRAKEARRERMNRFRTWAYFGGGIVWRLLTIAWVVWVTWKLLQQN